MKILNRPSRWSRKVTCPRKTCRTEMEIYAEDLFYSLVDEVRCDAIECCYCGKYIRIDDLPGYVENESRGRAGPPRCAPEARPVDAMDRCGMCTNPSCRFREDLLHWDCEMEGWDEETKQQMRDTLR